MNNINILDCTLRDGGYIKALYHDPELLVLDEATSALEKIT